MNSSKIKSNDCSPHVSVIIPTYNRKTLLRQAILSVLEQSYQDFELIIVDDGSNDNTHAMIAEFDDVRLRYIYQPNKGRSSARNVGLNLAKGHYIAFLDSDDMYLREKLALQVKYLDCHPSTGMIYTAAYCIDETGKMLSAKYQASVSGLIYKKIAFFVPVTITLPTVMVRRDLFEKLGGFDEKMHRFEDTDMWRRISKITRIDAMNIYTCKLRTHADNHLFSQNPAQLVQAVHYYAQKILQEDNEQKNSVPHRRLGGFYYYYARALMRVPEWKQFSYELLQFAFYYWPLYKIKYKIINQHFKIIIKKYLSKLQSEITSKILS